MSRKADTRVLCDVCLEATYLVSDLEGRSLRPEWFDGCPERFLWVRVGEVDVCPCCIAIISRAKRLGLSDIRRVEKEMGKIWGNDSNPTKWAKVPTMNELIATEIMDWHWDANWGCLVPPGQVTKPSEMWSDWLVDEEGEHYKECITENWVSGVSYNCVATKVILPDFSGNMEKAWRLVVERMVDTYDCMFAVEKVGKRYQFDNNRYSAEIAGGHLIYERPDCALVRWANSGSLAICEAALAVIRCQELESEEL